MNCSMCEKSIIKERVELGYTICTDCSIEEKKVGHIIYPHKTGAFVQVVSKSTHDKLNKLDRRGYKSKSARQYKSIVPKKNKEIPLRKDIKVKSKVNHMEWNDVKKKVNQYYNEWGYERTLNFIKKLNVNNDIPLLTRCKLQDMVTERYITPSPRALIRKFNKGLV